MAHSLLKSLPPELLHVILSNLDTASLLKTRLTCRLLSVVALDHFGDEIPLVFHCDKFRAISEIATHPVLSKRMKSLYYAGDLIMRQEWYEWYIRRSPEAHYRNAVMEFPTEIELRARISRSGPQRALGVMDLPETRTIADIAAFGRFNELLDDQARIVGDRLDTSCLRIVFEGCPKLREVTLAFRSDDGHPQRRLKAARTAFAEARTVAHGHSRSYRIDRHHLVALAQALQDSGRSLDSLTLVNVYYDALYGGTATEDFVPDLYVRRTGDPFPLRVLVRPLRRLRVFMNMADRRHEMEYRPREPESSVFTEAPDLRVLRIRLPDRVLKSNEQTDPGRVMEALYRGINLNYVFRGMTYHHLYELSLANCSVCGHTFTDFVLRHKETLRRLSLRNMSLGTSPYSSHMRSWRDVFTQIAGRLPNIHKVRLRGFYSEERALAMDWRLPQTAGTTGVELFCPARDAIENYILVGGLPPWDQILSQERNLRKPRWEPKGEGHVAPVIPDNDQPLDDPAREYEEDEFDV